MSWRGLCRGGLAATKAAIFQTHCERRQRRSHVCCHQGRQGAVWGDTPYTHRPALSASDGQLLDPHSGFDEEKHASRAGRVARDCEGANPAVTRQHGNRSLFAGGSVWNTLGLQPAVVKGAFVGKLVGTQKRHEPGPVNAIDIALHVAKIAH